MDTTTAKSLIASKQFSKAIRVLRDNKHPVMDYVVLRAMPSDFSSSGDIATELTESELLQLVRYAKHKYNQTKLGGILSIIVSLVLLLVGLYGIFQVYKFGFSALIPFSSLCCGGILFWVPLGIGIFNY